MNEVLRKIDQAVQQLRAAGCRRDPIAACWVTSSGVELASDPIKAWSLLRRSTVQRAIDAGKDSRGFYTR